MKCVVCKEKEATQKHHISYEPSLVISICKPCHQLIHKTHGVGAAMGEEKKEKDHPFFTYREKEAIYDSKTNELLDQYVCRCGCNRFTFYVRKDQTACYMKCSVCGQDWQVTRIEQKQKASQLQQKLS